MLGHLGAIAQGADAVCQLDTSHTANVGAYTGMGWTLTSIRAEPPTPSLVRARQAPVPMRFGAR